MKHRKVKKGKVSKAVKNYVAKLVDERIEDKFIIGDTTTVSLSAATVCERDLINGIGQGSNFDQRTGNKIRIKWVKLKTVFELSANSSSNSRIRIVDFVDTITGGGLPQKVGDLNGMYQTGITANQGVRSPLNPLTFGKVFKHVKDKTFNINNLPYFGGAFGSVPKKYTYSRTMRFGKRGLVVDFSGTGNTILDIQKNSIISMVAPDILSATATYETWYHICYEDA